MGSIRSYDDWTGNIIPGADIRSLDPEAVAALRAVYSLRNPESDVVPETDPAVFLSKTGFLKKGKITVASAILLGKSSENLVPPSVCIRYRNTDPESAASEERIFRAPMILSITQAVSLVKNSSVSLPGSHPRTVSSYRIETLREAVCNAIAFQDYSLGGTVDIIERERESVTIRSRGSFGQASPESFAGGRASSCSRRNAFLRSAMQRSGIVPGKCSGIRGMYLSQIYRHFPLPVFSCDDNTVSVTFFGTRFGAVPKILDSYPKTDAGIIMDLDRIYRGVRIPEKRLRILIETGFADTSGGVLSVSHIDSPVRRGSDRDSVLEFLKEGPASRSEVAEFLSARSPKSLTREQLDTRATNILQTLRKEGKIVKISGNTKSAVYGLKSD